MNHKTRQWQSPNTRKSTKERPTAYRLFKNRTKCKSSVDYVFNTELDNSNNTSNQNTKLNEALYIYISKGNYLLLLPYPLLS